MALPIVDFRAQLFNVVADVVMHVTQWLRYWNVHFFDPSNRLFQCLKVLSRVLRLVCRVFELLNFLLEEEPECLVGFTAYLFKYDVVVCESFDLACRLARFGLVR